MPVQSYAPYATNAVRTVGKQRPRSGAGVRQGGNARVAMKSRQQPGKTVGHYMLGKTIGEGTFGKVKMGTHILTGEKVAVKVLEKSRICEKADVTRVAREIKILKRNLHHNVIQLFEVLDTPATIYLIMENADRGELFDYIVAHQRVEEPQACYFFHQIIDGVDYLHQMEVTHRDLKPENLLLQNSSRGLIVKIVDFGLSNTHDGGRKLKTACGSPCYAAPEMIAGNGEKYYEGPKADLWSVGVILFALVCGYLPFEDANTTKLYKKILAGDYTAPKWISAEVRDLISKILNTNPATRYTIAHIRKHVWYNRIDMKQAPAVDKPGESEIDEAVIVECEKLGLNRQALTEAIIAGHHNNATTTYYLLKKKLFRENARSVAAATVPSKPAQGQAHRAPEAAPSVPAAPSQPYAQQQIQPQTKQRNAQSNKVKQPQPQVSRAQAAAPPQTSQLPSAASGSAAVRVASGGIRIRNIRSRGNARPGQARPVQIPRLKIPSRGGAGGQRQGTTMREQAMEASKTARAYRAKPIVRTVQQPASARAAYGNIGVEQLVAPQGGPMAPRVGYVPKPQAPVGSSRRPQPFSGHGGRRVADPTARSGPPSGYQSGGSAAVPVPAAERDSDGHGDGDRPPTRGSSRGDHRGDT